VDAPQVGASTGRAGEKATSRNRYQYLDTQRSEENMTAEARARQVIRKRRGFEDALVGFVVVNALLVVIWAD
jgi:hypothetical protein